MLKVQNVALAVGASLIAALGVPTLAKAESLPTAAWGPGSVVGVNGNGINFAGATDFATRTLSDIDGFAQVESTATPLPSITTTVSMSDSNSLNHGGEALGHLEYFGEVVGVGNSLVDVTITSSGSLLSMANADIASFARAFLFVNGETIVDLQSNNGVSNVGAFTASVTLSLLANTPFSIDMLAETFIQSASLFGSASIIGPRFVIDPLTPNADQYSIQLSPGLGNGAVVPLPPAVWLFGSALGLMGGWAKRKQAT